VDFAKEQSRKPVRIKPERTTKSLFSNGVRVDSGN
jgi:hypothetical protein